MREVFADTGYWVAVIRGNDALHEVVISLTQRLASYRIVTTEMVLAKILSKQQRAQGRAEGRAEERKRSNAKLRAWAKQKGIPLDELPIEDETETD